MLCHLNLVAVSGFLCSLLPDNMAHITLNKYIDELFTLLISLTGQGKAVCLPFVFRCLRDKQLRTNQCDLFRILAINLYIIWRVFLTKILNNNRNVLEYGSKVYLSVWVSCWSSTLTSLYFYTKRRSNQVLFANIVTKSIHYNNRLQ